MRAPESLLCGDADFAQWDVDDDTVGLHAVISGPFLNLDEDASSYMTRHMVALNVDAGRRTFAEMLDDDPADATEAWATTIPHKAIHLADLLRVGDGKTPDEIWAAEGDWGLHVASTLNMAPSGTPCHVQSMVTTNLTQRSAISSSRSASSASPAIGCVTCCPTPECCGSRRNG